jgi:hypothetical protein
MSSSLSSLTTCSNKKSNKICLVSFELIALMHTTSDDQLFYNFLMFSYGFQSFIVNYVNVKINLI